MSEWLVYDNSSVLYPVAYYDPVRNCFACGILEILQRCSRLSFYIPMSGVLAGHILMSRIN